MTSRPARLTLLAAAAAVAGCVSSGGGDAAQSPERQNPLLAPVQMQDYVPGGGARTPRKPTAEAPPTGGAQAQSQSQPRQPSERRGSGTSPDILAPAAPVRPTPPSVAPKDTTGDTARFKRDLLQPEADKLKRKDDLGRLDPFQKRDLFNREQELHRLQTDPQRR